MDKITKIKKVKKSIKDFEAFPDNPFDIEGLIIKTIVNNAAQPQQQFVDADSGEVFRVVKLNETATEVVLDPEEFIKVFKKAAPNMGNMTVAGLKVWTYIIYNLKPCVDYIQFDHVDCGEWCHYSQVNQVYNGLVNLLEEGFIAKGKRNVLWINPNYFYNGKRQSNKTLK